MTAGNDRSDGGIGTGSSNAPAESLLTVLAARQEVAMKQPSPTAASSVACRKVLKNRILI
jgi:hypothetical protein